MMKMKILGINKYAELSAQQRLIEKHFDWLSCKVTRDNIMVCSGWISQPDCDSYKVKIEYVYGREPKTSILSPIIEPSKDIHMYQDHSLCLHYPPDMWWNGRIKIYMYTIPWISEWICCYEIYKITGRWEGTESPVHFRESDKNINVDH